MAYARATTSPGTYATVEPQNVLFTSLNGIYRIIREKLPTGPLVWRFQQAAGDPARGTYKTLFTSDDRNGLWRELERRKIDDPALTSFIQTQLPYKAT